MRLVQPGARAELEDFLLRGRDVHRAAVDEADALHRSLCTFASEAQRTAVVRAMLASLHLEFLWSDHGPTEEALALLEASGGYLSSGERTLLFLAFDIWNGEAHLPFDRVLYALDPTRQMMVGTFLIAFATGTVEVWLRTAQGWIR